MTDKTDDRVGHLNAILARGGRNLNDPIFTSSNSRALPGGWMLKFRVDRRIKLFNLVHYRFVMSMTMRCSKHTYVQDCSLTFDKRHGNVPLTSRNAFFFRVIKNSNYGWRGKSIFLDLILCGSCLVALLSGIQMHY